MGGRLIAPDEPGPVRQHREAKGVTVDLEFTDDQVELRRSVRSFLERECPPEVVRRVVETGEPADKLWLSMTSLDWPALALPEDCGGIGLSFVEVAVVVEELGYAMAPGPFLSTVTQFVPVIAEAGTPPQRSRYLGQVARGDLTGTLALADHPGRWRVSEVSARAVPAAGGWRIDGKKHAVLAEPDVGAVAIAARVEGSGSQADGEIGLFVVPGDQLDLRPVRSLDASRPLATVVLDGLSVGADQVIGVPGPQSTQALIRARHQAMVALALETLGTCQRMVDLTLQYAKDRQQFGVPIGSFQAVKHKMVDLFVAVERARSLCYFAVAAIAEDDPQRSLAAAMAKASAHDAQRLVCQHMIQTLGGIGFTWEHDAHLYMKRAESTGALFGTAPEHRLDIATELGVRTGAG
jgi:alkylation response protein AidB-like acyl-CoA dehydrogenase